MKLKRNTKIYMIIIFLILIIMLIIFITSERIDTPFFSLTTVLATFIAIILSVIDTLRTIEEKNIEGIDKKYDEIKNSVIPENSVSEKNTDILELMLANMREINDYYVLSKTQAQNSFILAVAMCIVGILLMGVSICAAFIYTSNVITAIIPAISAAIVEVIAGTSLFVYKKSLAQLNRYFNSLHSNERFLSIVNIVSKASPEIQDDMYFEIIKSQIGLVSTDMIENSNDENGSEL